MYSLESVFELIDEYIPEVYEFIDIDKVKIDAHKFRINVEKNQKDEFDFHKFIPLGFKSDIKDVFPEIQLVREGFENAFVAIPNGVEKTEAWLYSYAIKAYANADVEALIYFKSQGETLISPDIISDNWRKAICRYVERDNILNKGNDSIISKSKNNELSLGELAELYEKSNFYPDFFIARDEEEDFIPATFLRAADWFELDEFEPWINAYIQEISTAYQGGVDPVYSLFPFFYWCRSDIVLEKASRFGLEAMLYGLCVGNIEPSKSWRQYWEGYDEDKKRTNDIVDYIPTASVIAFGWTRLKPTNINHNVINKALLLLMQTQLPSGAWPLTSKHKEGDIFSTYLAMIALGVSKPKAYQRYLDKAKYWLLAQQTEVGCWHIQGGPAIMINILCIEAIKLAEGNNTLTFRFNDNTNTIESDKIPDQKPEENKQVNQVFVQIIKDDSIKIGDKNKIDKSSLGSTINED